MANSNNELLIENENLFRSLVCAPVAVWFVLLAANSVMTSGMIIFQIIFVLLAIYFTLSSLAYASYYTNERYQGDAKPFFNNQNLAKCLIHCLLTLVFATLAYQTVTGDAHLVFKVVSVVLALYFSLSFIAYGAYYTNDLCESDAH
ncbi:hypothetical protein [Thalassotalea litorea]|uniref:hypothetical protein n=1 Tax=Thalassotalea litorea TaxID=2020715 RepID=UPI003736DF91